MKTSYSDHLFLGLKQLSMYLGLTFTTNLLLFGPSLVEGGWAQWVARLTPNQGQA